MLFGRNTTRNISKLSPISLALQHVKLRTTISKYHSWYLCQISLQIMLLPIQIEKIRNSKRAVVMGREKRRKPLFLSFHFPSFPALSQCDCFVFKSFPTAIFYEAYLWNFFLIILLFNCYYRSLPTMVKNAHPAAQVRFIK